MCVPSVRRIFFFMANWRRGGVCQNNKKWNVEIRRRKKTEVGQRNYVLKLYANLSSSGNPNDCELSDEARSV